MSGNNVSHSMRHTRRRWNVNLQKVTVTVNGKKKRVRISTTALRTMRKNAKAAQAKTAPKAAEVKAEAPKAEEVKAEAPKAEVKAEEKPAEVKEEKKTEAAK
jgi:large subunit ribosomal protein L28